MDIGQTDPIQLQLLLYRFGSQDQLIANVLHGLLLDDAGDVLNVTIPYVMAQLDGAEVDPLELHRAVVNIAEKMKAVDNTQEKNADKAPYLSWTLSLIPAAFATSSE